MVLDHVCAIITVNQGPTTTIEPADEGLPGPPSPRVKSSEGIPSCEVFINQVTPSSCLQASIKKGMMDLVISKRINS